MTKLRTRLLVTLVLTAVTLSALGIGLAAASTSPSRESGSPSFGSIQNSSQVNSGEPDTGGQSSPLPPVKSTNSITVRTNVSFWLRQIWNVWYAQFYSRDTGHRLPQ